MGTLTTSAALRTAAELLHAPLGHNRPALDIPTHAELAERHHGLIERRDQLLAAAGRAPNIDNDEAEKQATEYLALVQACIAAAKAAHTKEKLPWLTAGRIVDRFFIQGVEQELGNAAQPIRRALGAYKAAKAKAGQDTQSRGDSVGLSSLRTIIRYRVDNIDAVPRRFMVVDDAAVMRALRAGEAIPGIERIETADVRVSR
jgi:hypothetical protein